VEEEGVVGGGERGEKDVVMVVIDLMVYCSIRVVAVVMMDCVVEKGGWKMGTEALR